MKHIVKSIFAFALAMMMTFGVSASAYAATNDEVDTAVSSVEATEETQVTPRSINISTSWTTILSSSSGFNRNVTVSATTLTLNGLLSTVPCDIRLLGKNDKELWSKDSAVPGNGKETVFWCGSDVYKVQIRTTAGNGIASAW